MQLSLDFTYSAFLVSYDVNVRAKGVSFELGLGDDLLFGVDVTLFRQSCCPTPLILLSSWQHSNITLFIRIVFNEMDQSYNNLDPFNSLDCVPLWLWNKKISSQQVAVFSPKHDKTYGASRACN